MIPRRYPVLCHFAIDGFRARIPGLIDSPVGFLDADDGFLLGKRYLLLDRDPLYTKEFRSALERGGVRVVHLPPRSPNLNAYAERFVPSDITTNGVADGYKVCTMGDGAMRTWNQLLTVWRQK